MKKQIKKRILSLGLAVCMTLTMMPSMVFAAGPDTPEDESKPVVTEAAPAVEEVAAPAAEVNEISGNISERGVMELASNEITVDSEDALRSAIEKAKDGDTIKLKENITGVTESIYFGNDKASIRKAKSMVLDLNGKILSGSVGGALIAFLNSAGEKTANLNIVDSSGTKTGGTINNETGTAINAAGKNANIMAEVEIDGGINISGGVSTYAKNATLNMTGFSKLTVKNAVVDGTKSQKAISVSSTDSLDIQDGVFYGKITIAGASGSVQPAPTRSITKGYFSDYNAEIGGCVSDGHGLVPNDSKEEKYKGMFKIDELTDEVKTGSEAKVDLSGTGGYVYGTLQQLFDLYGVRGKKFEVINDASLTLNDYGTKNPGVFEEINTLEIDIADGKTLTLNSNATKVAKFIFTGSGSRKGTISAAEGYTVEDSESTTVICDFDHLKGEYIATAVVGGQTRYLTKDNIDSFLKNIPDGTTAISFEKNYSLKSPVRIPENVEVEIDLGGHTLSYTGNLAAFVSTEGGTVTVKNGTIDASESESGMAISLGITSDNEDENGKLTDKVEPNYTANGKAVIGNGAKILGTIGVFNNSELTMENGSSVWSTGFAIAGNGAHGKTKITINNGASVESTGTAAIYHPQDGELTIGEKSSSAVAPEITGKAGVVVRDGTVTVNDANITATGTEPLQVGDAKDADGNPVMVPAGGIVLDEADGYNKNSQQKVTVVGGTVEAADGQPSVVHTENGEEVQAKVDTDKPNDNIEVQKGSTLKSGDKADLDATKYLADAIDGNNTDLAVDPVTGTVEDAENVALYIIDFGYLDQAPATNKYTSPNGYVYNATGWKDATFYWSFNRALTADEAQEHIKVSFKCGDVVFSDTCEAQGQRFASSFLNDTQNDEKVSIIGGNWTIESEDDQFSVNDSVQSATVTIPDSVTQSMPVVSEAKIAKGNVDSGYTAEITSANTFKNEYTVSLAAKDLKEHENAEGKSGHWVGFAVKDPETNDGFYYRFGGDNGVWRYSKLETLPNGRKGVAFYFGGKSVDVVDLIWSASAPEGYQADGDEIDPSSETGMIRFTVDFSDVEYYTYTPSNPSNPGGPSTPTNPDTVEVPTPSNGTVSVDKSKAEAGDTVTVTPKANDGYVVDQVTVTDKSGNAVEVKDNGNGTYSFVMPEKAQQPVKVNVTFKKDEGGEVTPPTENALVFSSENQADAIKNRITTDADTALKLKAADEGVDIGDLTKWDVTSDNEAVVEVLRPSNMLHYVGVGTANITVKATGSNGKVYSIVIPISVKLGTPTFTLSHVSSKKARTFTVTTSTVRGADGFQVKYSLKKSLKSSKTKTYECGKKLKRQTVKANKSKRTYYVRVRAYIIDEDGNITTGAWSKLTKKIKSR